MTSYNVYLQTAASDETEAREVIAAAVYADPSELTLVHTAEGEDEEEFSTFVFGFWADDVADEEELDKLHDLYDGLDHLPNLPIEDI